MRTNRPTTSARSKLASWRAAGHTSLRAKPAYQTSKRCRPIRVLADARLLLASTLAPTSDNHRRVDRDYIAGALLADTHRRMIDFAPIVERMKLEHDIRVRKWRASMSGCAWRVYYTDGRVINWIEAPYPRTPISLAIFLHEVGHHVIGFDRFKKRCEEEYHVWIWALKQMRSLGIQPDARTLRRFDLSMQYAVGKAMRRGVRALPEQLEQFLPKAA